VSQPQSIFGPFPLNTTPPLTAKKKDLVAILDSKIENVVKDQFWGAQHFVLRLFQRARHAVYLLMLERKDLSKKKKLFPPKNIIQYV
jgi:hypothetical protein